MKSAVNQQPLPPRRLRGLAQRLVDWYREHARDLPWRRTRDPYAIWVSEIMLQQTRVETVRPRFERFLERFPSVEALAEAPLAEVLAEWAGLGYYRRARQLHEAARAVARSHGGRLPTTAAALRLLPGFGAYTAGAVASIAHGEPVAAVDGNVERVFARLVALREDPKRGEGARTVRALAEGMVREAPPPLLNQALMELGATVCTPRDPSCRRCPWLRSCRARRGGDPEAFPRRPRPRAAVEVACYAAVLRRGARLLWRRRPEVGHNAGLWELPTTDWHEGEPDPRRAREELGALAARHGGRWEVGEPLARVRHAITHHRVRLVGYEARGEAPGGEDWRWADAATAREWGITAAAARLLERLPSLL